jgi:hypothetical protein
MLLTAGGPQTGADASSQDDAIVVGIHGTIRTLKLILYCINCQTFVNKYKVQSTKYNEDKK